MKGVSFELSFPRLAAARIAGIFSAGGFLRPFGLPLSPVRLRELPEPTLPADDWLTLEPLVTGVCGSDIKEIFLDADLDNPLRHLISFPHVLGHEVAARVREIGPKVTGFQPGDRVAVSPWLPCEVRGLPPCPNCRLGDLSLCDNFAAGPFSRGIHAGNCRDIPGGYSDRMIAHQSACFRIPENVDDEQAALADPFAVALHAIQKAPPKPGETALVYGCGPLGLLTVQALARLYSGARVIAVDLHEYLRPFAHAMGANDFVVGEGPELLEKVAALVGARVSRAPFTLPWITGGVDRVYDTVGIAQTLETAVRLVKPAGTVVQIGVGTPRRYEWTPVYFREVTLVGSNAYGLEEFEGQRRHGFAHYLDLCAKGRIDARPMITHRYGLDAYRPAFLAARCKLRHQSVKVVFDFRRSPAS